MKKIASAGLLICLICLSAVAGPTPEKKYGDFSNEAEAKEWLAMVARLNRQGPVLQKVITQHLLSEANHAATEINLPTPHPLTSKDIISVFVPAPSYSLVKNTNYASAIDQTRHGRINAHGTIETTNYQFVLDEGRLVTIQRINQGVVYDGFDHDARFIDRTIPPLLMTTNEAYQLATQWLNAIDVKVAALEKKYGTGLNIEQAFYTAVSDDVKDEILKRPDYTRNYSLVATNKVLLPIWQVIWPGGAEVRILGTKHELNLLHCMDKSLSRRPPLVLPMVNEIEKYSGLQSNLPAMQLHQIQTNSDGVRSTNKPVLAPGLRKN